MTVFSEPLFVVAQTPQDAAPAVADVAFKGGLEQALLSIATQSATSILYLLIFLSVLSFAIAVEKYIQYRRANPLGEDFKANLVRALDKGDVKAALGLVEGARGIKAAVLREGLKNFHEGPRVLRELMDSRHVIERGRLDRRLIVLGTIGNNAPFIGLLGTVMGIIHAFHDLAKATTQGPATVMAGISEALVATAVGLFVAIPAVIFFNYFKAQLKGLSDDAQATSNIVMAFASRPANGGADLSAEALAKAE
ncbi:MAG: MotA/TolQ/ExbB proton channel family protein [Deltaproteobacteria bacterium]|nr:MotA/TolQ/ExbB proton channel family protein [Deltaproteobacteria bacterium]